MENSKIEWTDHTFNCWIGCTKVSEACRLCYAKTLADDRFGWAPWGAGKPRVRTSAEYWKQPLRWNRRATAQGRRARVFCASLADVFDAEVPQEWRDDLWALIRITTGLDWLLLTKRPENITLPANWGSGWANVWLGVTAENQRRADERLPVLLAIPSVVHFASCEPLLEHLDLSAYLGLGLDWVIAGGESGHGAGRMHPAWARDLRDQCVAANVPYFFKQWGDIDEAGTWVGKKRAGRELDGRTWDEFPTPAAGARLVDLGRQARGRALPRADAVIPITPTQRETILALVAQGRSSEEIAATVGVTRQQAAAVRAHRTMRTYE